MNNFNQPYCANVQRRGSCNVAMHNNTDSSDKCHPSTRSPFPASTAPAMAYIPFQQSGEVYSAEKALCRGTIFPCLDKPFLAGCCK